MITDLEYLKKQEDKKMVDGIVEFTVKFILTGICATVLIGAGKVLYYVWGGK